MNNIRLGKVAALILLIFPVISGMQPEGKPIEQSKAAADLSQSKVTWNDNQADGQHTGYLKLTGGEILLDNKEIKGGSFTMDMASINYPTASFVMTKIKRLPVVKTDQGDIKTTHTIEGDLTMKGKTHKISFEASVSILNGKVAISSQPFMLDKSKDITLAIDLVTK
jgi:polyisoprenoid-binding protein YceI